MAKQLEQIAWMEHLCVEEAIVVCHLFIIHMHQTNRTITTLERKKATKRKTQMQRMRATIIKQQKQQKQQQCRGLSMEKRMSNKTIIWLVKR